MEGGVSPLMNVENNLCNTVLHGVLVTPTAINMQMRGPVQRLIRGSTRGKEEAPTLRK